VEQGATKQSGIKGEQFQWPECWRGRVPAHGNKFRCTLFSPVGLPCPGLSSSRLGEARARGAASYAFSPTGENR
jgi:hypothetical protein